MFVTLIYEDNNWKVDSFQQGIIEDLALTEAESVVIFTNLWTTPSSIKPYDLIEEGVVQRTSAYRRLLIHGSRSSYG